MKFVNLDKELLQFLNHDQLNNLKQAIYQMDHLTLFEQDIYWILIDQTISVALETGLNIDDHTKIFIDTNHKKMTNALNLKTEEQTLKVLFHFLQKTIISSDVKLSYSEFEQFITTERLYLLIPEDIYNRITNKPVKYKEFEEIVYYSS